MVLAVLWFFNMDLFTAAAVFLVVLATTAFFLSAGFFLVLSVVCFAAAFLPSTPVSRPFPLDLTLLDADLFVLLLAAVSEDEI